MTTRPLCVTPRFLALGIACSFLGFCSTASATEVTDGASAQLPSVQVAGKAPDRDEKLARNLLRALQLFELHKETAPNAVLRFKVYPRHDADVMNGLALELRGDALRQPLELRPDGTFLIDSKLVSTGSDILVRSNRPPGSLAWRPDIRTPGLPPGTRRLGDLRLECRVDISGTGQDLASGIRTPAVTALTLSLDDPCASRHLRYAWFADEPVFSITLVSEKRRWTLPCMALWVCDLAGPSAVLAPLMDWYDLLRDRTFSLPLWDKTWPDDTLVVFDNMSNDPVKHGAGQ
jgi:hypothetical protein